MGIGKTVCRPDGDVQYSLLYFLRCSFIKSPVADSVLQASVFHPFGKDRRYASDLTYVVAGDNIRVQTKIDPVFAFCNELLFSFFTAFGEIARLRAFHSQVCIPVLMVPLPHAAHPSVDSIGSNRIGFKNHISLPDFLIADGFRLLISRILQCSL